MSTTTSRIEIFAGGISPASRRTATAVEALLVYAGILFYIWRWQFTHPFAWAYLFAFVFATHLAHGDSLRALGLTSQELAASARAVLPIFLALLISLLAYALTHPERVRALREERTLASFAGYAAWCAFQQYLMQSYFHRRLMSLIRNPHLSSVVAALMFGAAHIPNALLVAATTLGGFVLAEIFSRHQSIWPLALTQAVGGVLIGAAVPASLIHHLRVGPGYYFYGIH